MNELNWCRCRTCAKKYNPNKTRADWRGYCSQACMHAMAQKHGYSPRKRPFTNSEYSVLYHANQIGDIPWTEPEPVQ